MKNYSSWDYCSILPPSGITDLRPGSGRVAGRVSDASDVAQLTRSPSFNLLSLNELRVILHGGVEVFRVLSQEHSDIMSMCRGINGDKPLHHSEEMDFLNLLNS